MVYASYGEAVAGARRVQAAVEAFTRSPAAAGLAQARRAWLEAREWYGQTEAFRFYGGPIDGRGGPEGRINTWPIDEAYVDAVASRPDSGIVNDRRVPITAQSLAALNEKHGEANISTGWHAIEFLLWGQDTDPKGPGQRPFGDFVDGRAPNADRRRAYLRVVTQLLADDLSGVWRAWAPAQRNYRAGFVSRDANLAMAFAGMGAFTRGELAGERLEVALDTQSQEDEQSCFSDNTHRDFVAGITGIRNVWRGEFLRADGQALRGPSLRGLVAERDARVAQLTDASIESSLAAALAIQPPFDQEIIGADSAPGRRRAFTLLHVLRDQADALSAAAATLGFRGAVATVRRR